MHAHRHMNNMHVYLLITILEYFEYFFSGELYGQIINCLILINHYIYMYVSVGICMHVCIYKSYTYMNQGSVLKSSVTRIFVHVSHDMETLFVNICHDINSHSHDENPLVTGGIKGKKCEALVYHFSLAWTNCQKLSNFPWFKMPCRSRDVTAMCVSNIPFTCLISRENMFPTAMQSLMKKVSRQNIFTSEIHLQKASNAELLCFLCCWTDETGEPTVVLRVIWNAMKLMWRHCNEKMHMNNFYFE